MFRLLKIFTTFADPIAVILERLGVMGYWVRGMRGVEIFRVKLRGGIRISCRLGTNDAKNVYDIFAANKYEPEDLPFFKVRKGWVVVDIGAGIGCFTIRAFQLGAALVRAFEPIKQNYRLLWSNCGSNGFAAELFPQAVGSEYGRTTIRKNSGDHQLAQTVELERAIKVQQGVCVDLLKISIKGGEFAIFDSLKQGELDNVKRIIVEYHNSEAQGFDHERIKAKLWDEGFQVWDRPRRDRKSKTESTGLIFAYRPAWRGNG